MWVPMNMVQTKFPSKGWGKKGKGKGKGKKKFTDLPESKQAEIQQKWADRAEEEGRTQVGNGTFKGTVVSKTRGYGWIMPSNPGALPKNVKQAMSNMTAEIRSKAEEHGNDKDRFGGDVLYFRACDRAAMDAQISKDMQVKFKVYVDSKGAGAMNVEPV